MRALLVAVVLALAGCTTFEPIARGVCGNGLLEDGEDCDSPAATCVACAVTCGSAADCPTAGYACGVDRICHAPAGTLAPPGLQSVELVDEIRVTDIDRDGIGDVVGVSTNAIDVRFGDPQASLATAVSIVTPPQTGPPAFGDLDGDGVLDVSLATFDGIVAYESPFGALASAVAVLPIDSPLTFDKIVTIDPGFAGAIGDFKGTFAFGFIAVDGSSFISSKGAGSDGASGVLCTDAAGVPNAAPGATLDPANVDVAVMASSATTLDIVLSLLLTTPTGPQLCLESVHVVTPAVLPGETPIRTTTFTPIFVKGPVPSSKPIWANLDFDSDPCPSLVDSDGGGAGLVAWAGSTQPGGFGDPAHCTLASTPTALPVMPDAGSDARAIGRIPLVPAAPFVESDLLVMTSGLYVISLSAQGVNGFRISAFEGSLAEVVSGDLDGNGTTDAVLRAVGDSGVDVLYRSDLNGIPGYVIERVPAEGVVSHLAIADFDGNGTADVAYTEDFQTHARLSVAYGDPGHQLHPSVQGDLPGVTGLVAIDVLDAFDPEGRVSDLVVTDGVGSGFGATLLHGSPQRSMTSFFDPRGSTDPLKSQPVLQIVSGHFAAGATAASPLDEILLLPNTARPALEPTSTLYRLDGTAAGLDTADPINGSGGGPATGQEVEIAGACPVQQARPCLPDSVLIAWPASAGHDLILGVDRQAMPQAFVLDPMPLTGQGSAAVQPDLEITAHVPAGVAIQTLFALDRDGDGQPELVAAFGPADGSAAGGFVESCTTSATGIASTCTDLAVAVRVAAPTIVACTDAASGHFAKTTPASTPSVLPDLIVVCRDAAGTAVLARVTTGSGGDVATLLATDLGDVRRIAIGDVTGDGLDDVIILRGDAGARTIAVLAQCSSHDAACIAGANP